MYVYQVKKSSNRFGTQNVYGSFFSVNLQLAENVFFPLTALNLDDLRIYNKKNSLSSLIDSIDQRQFYFSVSGIKHATEMHFLTVNYRLRRKRATGLSNPSKNVLPNSFL